VKLKMLGAFGLVTALMLTLGLFALARLRGDQAHLAYFAERVVPSTRAVGEINALMNQYRKDQFHYILARPGDRPLSVPDSIQGNLDDDVAMMNGYLAAYRSGALIEDPYDRALFDDFQAAFSRYVALSAGFARLAREGHPVRAAEQIGKPSLADVEWDALKSLISAWSNHKVATAQAAEDASSSSYRLGVFMIVVLLVTAVAIALAVAIVMARRTTRAVHDIGAAAKAISQGDIDQHVAVRSNDELGEMAVDFEAMTDYLRATVGIAESIAAGDLDVEVRPRSDRDALGSALAAMTDSLRGLARENERLLAASREEANTDVLTGLRNRRALMRDLGLAAAQLAPGQELVLALYDLDGFKQYNDTFGHPAGDALLSRLADHLRQAVGHCATAYRMGGDEFCVLARASGGAAAEIAARAAAALDEKGAAFAISCSYGIACLPTDATTAEQALRLADQHMYDHKATRATASRQSADVLLKVLGEVAPGHVEHVGIVARLAAATAERLGLPDHEVRRIELAAELHDVGKVAIPETILRKPGPLDDEEWDFMRRHTVIGERIMSAAPCLTQAAALVRSSHERYDGTGYPDRLAGAEIPVGASIIAVCDAFDAMTSQRPYSDPVAPTDALAELRRCAGTQFAPEIVEAFSELIRPPQLELRGAA
jgi:diguanylate cyclase (GGDEF)-like protein